MSNDVIKENFTFIIDNVIKKLLPYRAELDVHVDFYHGTKNTDSLECFHDFNYDFDDENLGKLPPMDGYDNIEIYTYYPSGQTTFHLFLDDIAKEGKIPNKFLEHVIYDYNSNHGSLLKQYILASDFPNDICHTSEAQYIAKQEIPAMMTSSIDLFNKILVLENSLKDNHLEQFEDYLETLDLESQTVLGVHIEHTGLGMTNVSLSYDATGLTTNVFPILEMPTEEFLDHEVFAEKLTRAFNEYMPYAGMHLHDTQNQSPLAMV